MSATQRLRNFLAKQDSTNLTHIWQISSSGNSQFSNKMSENLLKTAHPSRFSCHINFSLSANCSGRDKQGSQFKQRHESFKTLGNEEELLHKRTVARIMQDSGGKMWLHQNTDASRLHRERQQHPNPQITEEHYCISQWLLKSSEFTLTVDCPKPQSWFAVLCNKISQQPGTWLDLPLAQQCKVSSSLAMFEKHLHSHKLIKH